MPGVKYQEDKVCTEETERSRYPVKDLGLDLDVAVQEQWLRANAKFGPPKVIAQVAPIQRFQREWTMTCISEYDFI